MRSIRILSVICLVLALMFTSSAAMAQYTITNLVSNVPGKAQHVDSLLVNGWGLARSATGPFWVSDEGTGWSTLYTGRGVKEGLEVVVPSENGKGTGSPTGIVVNESSEFDVQGWPSIFLFATLDGTISGWAPQSNPNDAIIAVDNSATGAIYTGLAITSYSSNNFLYAADNWNNQVDVYDGSFNLVTTLTDSTVPAGFAVFGVQDINGLVYVSFVANSGGTGGYVDVFTESGVMVKRLISNTGLNQPWGFAAAPSNFGTLSNTLLITNNVAGGTIRGYNMTTGKLIGTVKDTSGNPIVINQLWGIEFGGGTAKNGAKNELFFTAGPDNDQTGLFGVIRLAK
jgi:uncharacterized protein (TIGR03118 family)